MTMGVSSGAERNLGPSCKIFVLYWSETRTDLARIWEKIRRNYKSKLSFDWGSELETIYDTMFKSCGILQCQDAFASFAQKRNFGSK